MPTKPAMPKKPGPERLPVPPVTKADMAFPTGVTTPPWEWVPDEFRSKPGGDYENPDNPWVRLVADTFYGRRKWTDWRALPKEGIDPEAAFQAVSVAQRNWGIKHEQKLATCAYMLSEWFQDFWFDGDTHSTVHHIEVPAGSK